MQEFIKMSSKLQSAYQGLSQMSKAWADSLTRIGELHYGDIGWYTHFFFILEYDCFPYIISTRF